MNRTARIGLGMTVLTVLCVAGTCATTIVLRGPLADLADCPRDVKPVESGVVDDAKRVHDLLPALGEVSSTHYRWREMRPRTCPDIGPMDYGYAGFAVLSSADALHSGDPWVAADAPTVDPQLAPFAPAAPVWQRSTTFDARTQAQVWFDAGSATVYFTVVKD